MNLYPPNTPLFRAGSLLERCQVEEGEDGCTRCHVDPSHELSVDPSSTSSTPEANGLVNGLNGGRGTGSLVEDGLPQTPERGQGTGTRQDSGLDPALARTGRVGPGGSSGRFDTRGLRRGLALIESATAGCTSTPSVLRTEGVTAPIGCAHASTGLRPCGRVLLRSGERPPERHVHRHAPDQRAMRAEHEVRRSAHSAGGAL